MRGRDYRLPLFGLVTTLYWFSMYAYVPTLNPYSKSLGASYKMVGLIAGSYGFSQLLVRVPMGMLSDGLRRRKAFVVGGFTLGVAAALGMFASPSPTWLLVSRFMSGVSASSWLVFTVLYASYFDSADAPKAVGMLNSLNFLGQMFATFLGGVVANAFGQRATFLLGAAAGAIGLAGSLAIVEVRPDTRPASPKDLLKVGTDRRLLTLSGLAIGVQLIVYGTIYGFSPVVAKNLGATSMQLGILTTIATIPLVISSALSGSFFAKKLGEALTVGIGFTLLALSSIAVPFAGSVGSLYVSQAVGGFGRGLTLPLLMGLSIKGIAAERRATAMGLFQALYAFGMFFGPTVVGVIADFVGLRTGFFILGAFGLGVAAASLGLLKEGSAPFGRRTAGPGQQTPVRGA